MRGLGSQSSAILAIRFHVEASFWLRRRSVRRHRLRIRTKPDGDSDLKPDAVPR